MNHQNVNSKIDKLLIEKRSFINGEYVGAVSKNIIKKLSPVDGRDLSGISACDVEDVNFTVNIANQSVESRVWLDKSLNERKKILLKLAILMEEHKEELALLDTIETGRAFKNYYHDSIPKAIESLRYFAESIDKYYDQAISPKPNAFATITREALGTVAIITPWNDPMVVSVWKLAPALLMGNSVILKPAEQSSFSILKVAALAKQAGIPDGVFNVLTGFGETVGKALALHSSVSGVFFTGSTSTGKKILQYAGLSNMKKVGLECGGKSAFIISKHCKNLTKACDTLAKNMFYNQGQICSAPSRVFVDHTIKQQVLELLIERLDYYVPNDPLDSTTEVGCVVSKVQKDKIQEYIDKGKQECVAYYTSAKANSMHPQSNYILPTLFVYENQDNVINQNEIFGPVLSLISTENIQESISLSNKSNYGLAASIWSNDLDEAYTVSKSLQAGIVHINSYGEDDNSVPFGGIKESGLGNDKSMHAFDEYSYLKTTWVSFNAELTG